MYITYRQYGGDNGCAWNTCFIAHTNLGREDVLIIELFLYPSHEVVDVLGSRAFYWLLNSCTICPVVLKPEAGGRGCQIYYIHPVMYTIGFIAGVRLQYMYTLHTGEQWDGSPCWMDDNPILGES